MNQWDNEKKENDINELEKINKLKKIYEKQEIPAELPDIIKEAILRAEKEKKTAKRKSFWKVSAGIAASLAIFIGAFGIGVANNEAFAASMEDVPILGSLVKVFTVEEIHQSDDDVNIDMKIPGINGLKDQELEDKINKEVYDKVNQAVKETKELMLEYKEAWLATGGTEEDFIPQDIQVDYEVKCINKDTLSFLVWKTETLASAYFEQYYYNYDLNENREITLEDILGKDYIRIANKQIAAEIKERSKNPDNLYWDGSEGIEGFQTITKDQAFYINQNGNPVIVFNKYEIAPGYMGIQEFEIKN